MKSFQVWTEGYLATGGQSDATFHGSIMTDTFKEACIKILGDSLAVGDSLAEDLDGNLCVWGCRCYDNETDARKRFG